MKSSAPWSVKGIKRDARETAKEAARREGMTVGEWLNQVIYSAGDPESSDGDIEGIKTSDLVTAIEHLNKRVISAESKGAQAIEDLARNIGGALERLQRLERTRPSEGSPAIEERLRRVESRAGDGQRIEALRALEKAVAQVALQYDAAHKTTLTRLESTERQLQELASRFDSADAASGGETAGTSALKEAIDGLAQRLEKAERIAAEAAKMKSEASDSVDAEFVERTGARLRILGDEIKRGGDQIRTLEGLIKKLSDQIDAAERRSSEGVQKVNETISQLRSQFSQPEAQEGGEIEAAMAEVTRRTEARISELQRSFETMIARLETAPADAPASAAEEEDASDNSKADGRDALQSEAGVTGVDFGDIEEDEGAGDPPQEGERGDEDAFSLNLDDGEDAAVESGPADETPETDQDIVEAAGSEDQEAGRDDEAEPASIDAMFAGFDDDEETESLSPASADDDTGEDSDVFDDPLSALVADRDDDSSKRADQPPSTSEIAAAPQLRRRNLTPKQRALIAAKIRRKRLAEQGLPVSAEPEVATTTSVEEEPEGRKSVFSRAAGALTALRGRPHGDGDDAESAPQIDEPTDEAAAPGARKTDDEAPNFTRAALATLNKVGVKPVTLALGAAIILAAAALFFVAKDIISSSGPTSAAKTSAPATLATPPATDESAASADASVPEAPEAPVTQPRALYLESVAELEAAKTEGGTREALKLLQQAAALGHPPAQLQLGELYKLGQGVEQNPTQARLWYQRAATGGNVLAMHRAGVMAARGQGGPTDIESAIDWFTKAANFGLVDSQYNLGATYHPASNGSANPVQDAAKAYYWYALAARNGDEQAKSLAAGLAASLTPDERRTIDEQVASWTAQPPDPSANEIASAT